MNQKDIDKTIEKDLRISMEDVFFERLEIIKTYYGIKNNTEIVRFMINEKYRAIVPSENVRNINEKIITSALQIYTKYMESGELQLKDIATALNISSRRLMKYAMKLKEEEQISKIVE